MASSFRMAMAWLHTWFGLVLGYVLMVCFFFGALSVFDREIDRWAIPETRFAVQPLPSFDTALRPALERMRPAGAGPAIEWGVVGGHRDPVLGMWAGYELPAKGPEEAEWRNTHFDPRRGALRPDDELYIGSGFFYPLHYNLNLHWMDLGYWLVGLAALAMLAALVSGVVIHRRLFREFFTFRPSKSVRRSTLDLHNATGVLALPFHFFFAYTGLLIFAGIYFPVTHTQLHALHELHERQDAASTGLPQQRAGTAAALAPVDPMVAEARRRWSARGMPGEVGSIVVRHVGDSNGYVAVYRAGTDRVVKQQGDGVYFRAGSGEVLHESPAPSGVDRVGEFLGNLHMQPFRHWPLRWLYFIGGLMGCVCIATGFLFFVEKRKARHAAQGSAASSVVDALAVAAVTGMVIATLGMLVANRLLPSDLAGKGDWEKAVFWGAWAASAAHALWRGSPAGPARINAAWREQCWALGAMAVCAALLNWMTTGDHLLKTTVAPPYWPVAGVDVVLLVSAVLAILAARVLARREQRA